MEKFALLARVEAKPGKEEEVLSFLKSALPLAQAESGTVRWYALQLGPSTLVYLIHLKLKMPGTHI
jgi:quinol monooxygenase YgiN